MSTAAERREIYCTPRWRALRRAVLEDENCRCRLCGRAGADTVDHIRSIRRGGAVWDRGNLRAVCRLCHAAKHAAGGPPGRAEYDRELGRLQAVVM